MEIKTEMKMKNNNNNKANAVTKLPKIVIIGAGSTSFGLSCIKDALTTDELFGSELVFVDINSYALDRMTKAAERINLERGAGYRISKTTDRCEALVDADFVILSIAVERIKLWKSDFNVPKKYGINHVLGENGGPGSVFHTMRNIPIILDICRDMERICPEALLINFTNPESRICLAINKYTRIKAVGLCHQIGEGIRIISKIMQKDTSEVDVKACGLNHLTWMMDIRNKKTGEDLYPLFKEMEKNHDPEFHKLSRYMFHTFGLFPTSGDGHLGEYVPYAHEMTSTKGYDFDAYEGYRDRSVKLIEEIIDGTAPINDELLTPSGEDAFKIIKGMTFNTNELIISANLPNEGYITNLPMDSIVEVPAVVSGNSIRGVGMGKLPRGIAAICQQQINVQHLVVDAGATGNKDLILQALLIDPNVPSAEAAESICRELIEINKPYLPQFTW